MLTFELARALYVIQDVCIKTQKTWIYIFPGTCKLQKSYFISIVCATGSCLWSSPNPSCEKYGHRSFPGVLNSFEDQDRC